MAQPNRRIGIAARVVGLVLGTLFAYVALGPGSRPSARSGSTIMDMVLEYAPLVAIVAFVLVICEVFLAARFSTAKRRGANRAPRPSRKQFHSTGLPDPTDPVPGDVVYRFKDPSSQGI